MGFPQELQHRRDRVAAGLDATELADRGLCPLLSEMLNGCDYQVFFGSEVMNLRSPGDTGEVRYPRRSGSRVAVGNQAFDGGIEQPRPHGGAALCLRPPNRSFADLGHPLTFPAHLHSGWNVT